MTRRVCADCAGLLHHQPKPALAYPTKHLYTQTLTHLLLSLPPSRMLALLSDEPHAATRHQPLRGAALLAAGLVAFLRGGASDAAVSGLQAAVGGAAVGGAGLRGLQSVFGAQREVEDSVRSRETCRGCEVAGYFGM